jgi:hypothetical protein
VKYEKIIKREDGSRVKLTASFYSNYEVIWHVRTERCEPKKRTFIEVKGLGFATPEEILACKLGLWEKIKPTL